MFRENIIAELKSKINQEPNNIENYRNLANYYIGSSDYDNALLVYEDILKIQPDDYQSLINMGSIYFYKKRFPEALKCNNKAKEV